METTSRNSNDRERLIDALRHALRVGEGLSDWMRDHTGPADGTVSRLTDWHEMREREIALLRELGESL